MGNGAHGGRGQGWGKRASSLGALVLPRLLITAAVCSESSGSGQGLDFAVVSGFVFMVLEL